MIKKLWATLAVVAVVAAVTAGSVLPAAAADGTVYVVHGIPGVTVDVYVNGTNTLPNFAPGTVAGPLTLPSGTYEVKIYAAGADPNTATPVITQSVDLPSGANASLVAGLDASKDPKLFTFVNDVSAAPAGEGRLAVGHTAAAPAVDVLANGKAAFTNLTNGNEDMANLPAGTVSASVVAAGTTSPALIGPADVPVMANMLTVVYAVGAPGSGQDASTLGVVTQQIPLAAQQVSVPTGTSGLLDESGGMPTWAIAALVVALLGIVASGGVLVHARSRA
jgi:Domain of unknown function (DUF4397)